MLTAVSFFPSTIILSEPANFWVNFRSQWNPTPIVTP